jgi:hypothetical protein
MGEARKARSGPRSAAVRGCDACCGPESWMPFDQCCGHPSASRDAGDWRRDANGVLIDRLAAQFANWFIKRRQADLLDRSEPASHPNSTDEGAGT